MREALNAPGLLSLKWIGYDRHTETKYRKRKTTSKREVTLLMENQSLVVLLLIVLDAFLWIGGTILSLSTTNRFRFYASAFIVLFVLLTLFFGWKNAAMIGFAGLWLAAILSNMVCSKARVS
ncbi:MAG: hypothetical protein P8N76_27360 [Pirellulaceae bacterium]|nr:hypothetical protein [Pirellulaceae bacterium]